MTDKDNCARLRDRVAVITGAGRGIGRAIAERFASEGAAIVVSSRTAAQVEDVADSARRGGGRACAVVADATDRESTVTPVRTALDEFGHIDILVNNVGGSRGLCRDPFSCPDGDFESSVTLNLLTAWWASRAALPHMRANAWGRIINIGSGASKTTSGFTAYTAAKHGLAGLTKELAAAGGRHGITVNCLCPGWTQTTALNWEAVGAGIGVPADAARQWAESQSLQGRILQPTELTGMAVLLASDDGAGVTGQVISVDGGYKV